VDRKQRLFQKLKTMPVQPWKEAIGKILAVLTFGLTSAAIIIIIVGLLLGGRFNITLVGLLVTYNIEHFPIPELKLYDIKNYL
jgi:ABC-type Na+ efflux pump permease subunit